MSWFKGISKDDWITWGAWQFPLLWVGHVGKEWTAISMVVCSLLGTLGGWQYGRKEFRWLVMPLFVCSVIYFKGSQHHNAFVFLAVPFMIKIAPAYGKDSALYKFFKNDLVVRLVCFMWYWLAILLANAL